jgi:hypothetical protein
MKIAVYGDSFGGINLINILGDNKDRGKSWVEVLGKKHDVTNFSAGGTSLFYSYEIFLQQNKNFDYNIFLITEPNRLTLNNVDNEHFKHFNLAMLDVFSKVTENSNTGNDKKVIDALLGYYSYIHNQKYIDICHDLMINNIININHNSLLIPCFPTSMSGKTSLVEITDYELLDQVLNLKRNGYEPWKLIDNKWTFADYRKCHLSEENNIILANIVDNSIINNLNILDINLNDYQKASKDIEFYYAKKTLTLSGFIDSRLNGELHNLLIDTN